MELSLERDEPFRSGFFRVIRIHPLFFDLHRIIDKTVIGGRRTRERKISSSHKSCKSLLVASVASFRRFI
ncbi:hypothetical protein YC2023_028905 [Brassica napus]